MEGLEDVGAVMGEVIPGPADLVASLPERSLGLLRMNYRKKITYVSNPLCLKLFYIGS